MSEHAKIVLIDGSFIHQAELNGISIRMGLIQLLGTKDLEEYTTQCVQRDLWEISQLKENALAYHETIRTAKRIAYTDCPHRISGKFAKGVECILSLVKSETTQPNRVKWIVATNNKDLLESLKSHNSKQEIVSVVGGVFALV